MLLYWFVCLFVLSLLVIVRSLRMSVTINRFLSYLILRTNRGPDGLHPVLPRMRAVDTADPCCHCGTVSSHLLKIARNGTGIMVSWYPRAQIGESQILYRFLRKELKMVQLTADFSYNTFVCVRLCGRFAGCIKLTCCKKVKNV